MNAIDLKEALKSVAFLRNAMKEVGMRAIHQFEHVKATPEYQTWLPLDAAVHEYKSRLDAAESRARALIVAAYDETRQKKPAPGAGIRITRGHIAVIDSAAAVEWAEKHIPAAVIKAVDMDMIRAWADKQDTLPDWLEKTPDKVTPTLASDLSQYLTEDDDA